MIQHNPAQDILMVGTGYVGLTSAVGMAKLGHTVACYDINPDRVAELKAGHAPYFEPDMEQLMTEGAEAKRLSFHASLAEAYHGQRYIFVAVQTPTNADGQSDLSLLIAAVKAVDAVVDKPALVIIKSTVPVGTFEQLEASLDHQKHFITLVSCPEFLAEGSAIRNFFNPTRTIVGSNDLAVSEEVAGLFYGLGGHVILTDAKTAQMIKYTANAFLATRVAFINDISQICEKFGINANDVSKALPMDPRLGGSHSMPGMSFCGPCLPKDILALIETSERAGTPALLLRGASEHNMSHLRHIIDTIISLVRPGDTIAVYGLSFKPNTDDVRNAFSLKIIETLLDEHDVHIRATDPQSIPVAQKALTHPALSYHADPYEAAEGSDLQLFLTPWREYLDLDFKRLGAAAHRKHVYDTMQMVDEAAVTAEGFEYNGIGRMYGKAGSPIFEVSENPVLERAE